VNRRQRVAKPGTFLAFLGVERRRGQVMLGTNFAAALRVSNWTRATRTTPGERHVFAASSHGEVWQCAPVRA
jgi:hypothetical protein